MLILSGNLLNQSILSLRTGGVVATTLRPIINPNNLKLEGFYCQDKLSKQQLVLLYQDIRNIIAQGFIINDHDVLSTPDILVRLQEVLKINFALTGKSVVTAQKEKVGKVVDFAVESETFFIQKFYVSRSIIKSFTSGQLSVDRSQVVEITDKHIVIQDLIKTSKLAVPASAV